MQAICLLQFIVLIVTTIYVVYAAPDNRGVEFVVGYMESRYNSEPVDLFVTTSKTTVVNVRVTAPRFIWANIDVRFTVTSGEVHQLKIDRIIRGVGTELRSKGILVTADDEVVVYGANIERYTSDAFLGYPVDVLGKEYYTVSQYPSTFPCEFMVIGVENGTSVTVTLGVHPDIEVIYDNQGNYQYYYNNEVINLNMDRFDTLQIQAMGDLTGSHISADKKVAVMSGNRRTSVPPGTSKDHLVEMMLPVEVWGRKFAIVPTPERTVGDNVRFMGSKDSTRVTITCSGGWSKSFNMDARHHVMEITPSDQCCYVESTEGIMVVLIVMSQVDSAEPADPSMVTIPPIEQYAADYTFATPKYSYGEYTNFFMFIVKDSEKGGLRVDGNTFPLLTRYTQIPNTDFVGGHIVVSPGTHTFRHISPICIFGGFLYGTAPLETYGMPAGLRMAPINKVCVPSTTVVGDGIDNDCDGLIDEELCTAANNGADDDGDGQTEEDCATPSPIDGGYTDWSAWTTCSISCNSGLTNGTTTRTRDCTNPEPKYDGLQCVGPSAESVSCTPTKECPVDGGYTDWSAWTTCSISCKSGLTDGTTTRTRDCTNPEPKYDGLQCVGPSAESVSCTPTMECPVDGGYTDWSAWTTCSISCKSGLTDGTTTRSRDCTNPEPKYDGLQCVGPSAESVSCTPTKECPIDGGYTDWSAWTTCSISCKSELTDGTTTRTRDCTNPEPKYDGLQCVGPSAESVSCTPTMECPVDGGYSDWSAWTTCSISCNSGLTNGTTTRTRDCTNPEPKYDGLQCVGPSAESVSCTPTKECPVDGNWGSWGAWAACSVSCSSGSRTRTRSCDSPTPTHNNVECSGSGSDTVSCDTGVPCAAAPDNRGVEFVVGYMESRYNAEPVDLFVTTSKTTVINVRVTAPRFIWANIDVRFTVTSGEVYQLKIDRTIRGVGTELRSKGILVTADNEVVVYGANIEKYTCDAFLAYPVDVLGTEYYTVSQHPSMYACEFMVIGTYNAPIVGALQHHFSVPTYVSDKTRKPDKLTLVTGVENGTSVTVTLGVHPDIKVYYNNQHYYNNGVINLNMDRFDTLQIESMGDLTGSHISADKKVAVMSGNRRTAVPPGSSKDHLVEMMLPVEVWGRKFVIVPTPERTVGDNVRFMGSKDSTSVTITCSGGWSKSFSMDARHHVMEITPSDQCCYVESTEGIMVVLIVMSQVDSAEPADPSMVTIPPIEQYAADYTFATPKYTYGEYTNFFMFIVKDSEKGGLRVDGNTFPLLTRYTQIPNTDFVGGHIVISPGTHTFRHISPICVFGGFLYGTAPLETYGMPAGLRMAPINKVCVPSTTVVGDGIDNDCDGLIDEELCTAANNGADDDGDGQTEEDCATPSPIDGGYTDWSAWTTCSISCKSGLTGGTTSRSRDCTNPEPKYDGSQCVGPSAESVSCTPTKECPIDGNWGSWGAWAACSVSCSSGSRTRTRSCDSPTPMHNGVDCSGSGSDTVSCDTGVPCPVDGGWADWTDWADCSSSCGPGVMTRNRTCTNPSAQYNGTECIGKIQDSLACNGSCIVNGNWGSWESWSACTKSCNIGRHSRVRLCDNPAPSHNGEPCSGKGFELTYCNAIPCVNKNLTEDDFVSRCPIGYFTCQRGTVACISTRFKCDCKLDCEDGSDETTTWAACSTFCVETSISQAPCVKEGSLMLMVAGLQSFLCLWTSM